MLWDLDDLAGVGDLAREWGVSSAAATNWRYRHDDFPSPLRVLSTGPVFSRTQVRRWRNNLATDDARVRLGPTETDQRHIRYAHVIDDLRTRIRAGEWAPGQQIPSRVELRAHYGVGVSGINYSISVLRREGLLSSVRASGTYVAFLSHPTE